MSKYNADNERMKRAYAEWRRNCRGCSEATLDAYMERKARKSVIARNATIRT